jgi:hypothetical protein
MGGHCFAVSINSIVATAAEDRLNIATTQTVVWGGQRLPGNRYL